MSDSVTVSYYKDGLPYNAKGEVIITITGKPPEGTGGGGGSVSTGNYGGATSQIGHSLAKWSTKNLQKTKAAQAKRELEFRQIVEKAKTSLAAMTNKLNAITAQAVAAAHSGPSAVDLAHNNNAAMEAEAKRLALAKAEAKAREDARKAEEALKIAQQKHEEEAKQLAETERKLKLAEEEEKRIAALSQEAKDVEYAKKNLEDSKSKLASEDQNISSLRKKNDSYKASLNNENKQITSKRAELEKLQSELLQAVETSKKLQHLANDPNQSRLFFNARSNIVRISNLKGKKESEISSSEKRINQLNNELKNTQKSLDQALARRNQNLKEISSNELKLKVANEKLSQALIKDAIDTTVGFFKDITEKYGKKYSDLAKNLAEKAKGKKIGNVNEAFAAYEKYKNVLDKKFGAKDREAIINALKSADYADLAKHLNQFAKYLKITGRVSAGYDIYSDIQNALKTGQWKPLFLTLEKISFDAGVAYIVAIMFSIIATTSIGIFGVAIVTGIICAFVDKNDLELLNNSLGL